MMHGVVVCAACVAALYPHGAAAFRAPGPLPGLRPAAVARVAALPGRSYRRAIAMQEPSGPAAAASAAVVTAEGARQGRRAVVGAAFAGVLAAGAPREAGALCGDKPASWEFWIPWNEELITVANEVGTAKSGKRSVFYRVVGDVQNENGSKDRGKTSGTRHLVLAVPDKFRDHEYLTTLEALVTSDRRVVLYDAMGTGASEPLSADQKAELEADEGKALAFAVKELADMWVTLQKELKVDSVHVFGHGFGALVANEFAKTSPSAISSLILASPPESLGKPNAKQVLVSEDPTKLCTKEATRDNRESFIAGMISFIDVVDSVVS